MEKRNTTLRNFLEFYFDGIENFTAQELNECDFAFDVREEHFDDDFDKLYEFLNDNLDEEITVEIDDCGPDCGMARYTNFFTLYDEEGQPVDFAEPSCDNFLEF